ncbi:MAG TPA: adenylate/guanylate cyclase domain-containing protein, partial [Actinomycetota bacterium]|nr:adenylate/guanylate cyclase domain-containing protein [Actinomycetota bacterium]
MEPNARADTEAAGGASPEGRLPSGTVTLLFSDIEGSTRMLQELGGTYQRVLEEHDALMREVFRRWRGAEFGHEGDAFFVSFASAVDALQAALEAQQRLGEHAWPAKPVRVRIGLHTGTPTLLGHDYIGLDVHRAARICAAGHGGQIVMSQAASALVGDNLMLDAEVRDLGEHQLPDLDRPEHLFQVTAPGLSTDFPPLRSVAAVSNLPSIPTSLVGRERELGEVETLLRGSGPRLVTLLGPGGTGKTRLAVQIARRLRPHYPGGVCFVALANVQDVGLVAGAIARALGVDPGSQTPSEAIEGYLRDRQMLLVLDNFEHVIEAADLVGQLLATCHALEVLVTSRTALRLSGEHEYGVPPLSVPAAGEPVSVEAIRDAEAVSLFRERARAVRPDFEINEANARSVAEICRSVDGLPLAIELAAARIRLMPPEALAS